MTGSELINLRIRSPSTPNRAEQELEVEVCVDASVRELKELLRPRLHVSPAQQLRLITSGKLLAPDSSSLDSFGLKDGCFVHVVISAAPAHHSHVPNNSAHRQGNSESTNNEHTDDITPSATAPTGPPRGFDSLLQNRSGAVSLTSDEINAIRAYFSDAVQDFARERMRRGDSESEGDFRFRAESEWMAVQGPNSEFRMNLNSMLFFPRLAASDSFEADTGSERQGLLTMEGTSETGTTRDFIYGLMLGYFLGFMMIFCVWDRHIPYRQKLGLLCGIMLQLGFGVLQHRVQQEQHSTATTSDGASPTTASASLVDPLSDLHGNLRGAQ